MRRDETLALFGACEAAREVARAAAAQTGKSAGECEEAAHEAAKAQWNGWAAEMLTRRQALEAAGVFKVKSSESWEPAMGENAETQEWLEAAVTDFSFVRFECVQVLCEAEGGARQGGPKRSRHTNPLRRRLADADERVVPVSATGPQVRFDGFWFPSDALFESVDFCGDACFRNTVISGLAKFPATDFEGEALFDGAAISGDALFDSATFLASASFENTKLSGNAWFSNAVAAGDVSFQGATISGSATFQTVGFAGGAWFAGATLCGDALFDGSKFAGTASFLGVSFSGNASFQKAEFFEYGAWFAKAAFLSTASFQEAKFKFPWIYIFIDYHNN